MRHAREIFLLRMRDLRNFFSAMDELTIRPIDDVAGLTAVEHLQRAVWTMPDLDVVPLHHLRAAVSAGGLVLGAFAGDDLVGFSYAFAGARNGTPLLYSHMTGVREEYRGRGVGLALKRAQREAALARGVDRIVWTFDPLQRANAWFNHHKLGAVASRYYVNYYGDMRDAINRGTDSDRLEVDWWIRDPRVDAALRGAPVATAPGAAALEIPPDFNALKITDPDAAQAWRLRVREAFLDHFARGYEVVDFTGGTYVLDRREARHADR
ncbi:MAG TPA: GNAT family N-acetyltransferase [bacterium]|jgi:predicted GNAT superfamily acetyltransferase|nr:GNAT family N-acetyltransferase [bacterium]